MKKRENLKEKVYTTIKKRILNFELKPGEKIFETEIADDLGVSRTPLREAFNKLEQEGLIKTLPNKGYFVSNVTVTEIEELYEIREALEVLAIRAAAKNSCKEDWVRLEQTLLGQTGDKGKDSEKLHSQLFKEAHEFHQEIARISGKETLQQMLNTVSERINRFQWMNIFLTDRAGSSRNEHVEIVKLLKQGKVEEAVAAEQKHIRHSKDTILNLLNKKKDLLSRIVH
jgi:DNA-binding GntR family transcriptional regulator